jgi:4a-hydroxytetrahydrobiopterin dehydratase
MLNEQEVAVRLDALDGWRREGASIVKEFRFADYHETMAFVNAVAWIAHRSDHHPDLAVGYNRCRVAYTTHDAGGLSAKDFDNAARIDALFRL